MPHNVGILKEVGRQTSVNLINRWAFMNSIFKCYKKVVVVRPLYYGVFTRSGHTTGSVCMAHISITKPELASWLDNVMYGWVIG